MFQYQKMKGEKKMLNPEQEIAVNNRNNNLLVSASAGSGKTFVLITRIVKMIMEEDVDVRKLLVVTFTNASAEELKQRLITKLSEEIVNCDENKKKTLIKQATAWKKRKLLEVAKQILSETEYQTFVNTLYPQVGYGDPFQRNQALTEFQEKLKQRRQQDLENAKTFY